MAFHHTVTARLNEIDRAGVVFFGRFFDYCHVTFEELLIALFGPLEASFVSGVWSMPLVHAEADFARPVFLGDRLDVRLEIAAVGTTSVTCAYTLVGPEGQVRAKVRLVHVCTDPQTHRPRAVPVDFVAALGRHNLWFPPLAQEPRH